MSRDANNVDFGGAIDAIVGLLDAVGEDNWIKGLRIQKRRWAQTGDASSHRKIYGGMGSFGDIVLCRSNGYRISKEQDLWIPELFEQLQNVCYGMASGRIASARRLVESRSKLIGWFCRTCGYWDVSRAAIESHVAARMVGALVREGLRNGNLISIVERVVSLDIPRYPATLDRTMRRVEESNIPIVTRKGWLKVCPDCGGADTCLYRWYPDRRGRFYPGKDNLSLRKPKRRRK